MWAIPLRAHGILQAGLSRPRYESGAAGIGKLENGRPKAISEVARLRRSLPDPDPENRAAISIRSARPPIITVIGASPVCHFHPEAALFERIGGAHEQIELSAIGSPARRLLPHRRRRAQGRSAPLITPQSVRSPEPSRAVPLSEADNPARAVEPRR